MPGQMRSPYESDNECHATRDLRSILDIDADEGIPFVIWPEARSTGHVKLGKILIFIIFL